MIYWYRRIPIKLIFFLMKLWKIILRYRRLRCCNFQCRQWISKLSFPWTRKIWKYVKGKTWYYAAARSTISDNIVIFSCFLFWKMHCSLRHIFHLVSSQDISYRENEKNMALQDAKLRFIYTKILSDIFSTWIKHVLD